MATLATSCDSCIEANIPHCSLSYQVCGVLTADTEYWSVITDRFGKKHIVNGTTDADGMWEIDPADYPDGFFSQHGGSKVLQFFTDQNLCDVVTLSIGDPAVDYTCISLKVFESSEEPITWDVMCLCEGGEPTPAPPTYYVSELYIDTTGYGLSNSIVSVNIDGVSYPSGSYMSGNIGGAAVNSVDFATSIQTVLNEVGIGVDEFYSFGIGSGGANFVAIGFVCTQLHNITIEWNDGNGNTYFSPLVTRIQDTSSLCVTHTGDSTVDSILDYSFIMPKFGGGTQNFNQSSALFSAVEFFTTDLYAMSNSAILYGGTLYPDALVTQEGSDYTVEIRNMFHPLTNVSTTNGTISFSACP